MSLLKVQIGIWVVNQNPDPKFSLKFKSKSAIEFEYNNLYNKNTLVRFILKVTADMRLPI